MDLIRTPRDLQAYIEEHKISAWLIGNIGDTPTVPAAAAALGVAPDQIIKTLLFLVEQPDSAPHPVVIISNGESRVDKKALAEWFGVGKKHIRFAPAEVVLDLLGYPVGGVPPFGHRTRLPVLLDQTVLDLQERFAGRIYAGGGDDHTMLELTVAELVRVTQAQIAPLSEQSGP